MSRYRRARTPGATYFFTVNTYRRQNCLTEGEVISALRAALQRVRVAHPFRIDARVVLPDHFHAVWTLLHSNANYSLRQSLLKRYTSQQVRDRIGAPQSPSRQKRRELGLWQRRFWEHKIRDDTDYARHVDYLHYNPVKHGLVCRVRDWPHSTSHRFVRLGLYPPDWAGGGIEEAPGDFAG